MPVPERRWQVAVVDDEEHSRRLVVEVLQFAGYDAAPFSSGERLLEALETTPYDLVVLDVLMPGLDGFAVASEIRRRASLTGLPILALTGLADPHDAVRILEAGADAYVSKPIDVRAVLKLVAGMLHDRSRGEGGLPRPRT